MAMFENFPYTNLHNLNLDWIIANIEEIKEKMVNVLDKAIKIADPPEWNANTAYEEYTIVFDTDGVYLSKQYVPIGIPTSNTEYWEELVDLTELYALIQDANDTAEAAQTAASGAQTAAQAAQTAAQAAQTTANGAQTAAQAAQTTANGAQTAAQAAQTSANTALSTANSAASTGAANTQAINALDSATVKNNSVKKMLYVGDSYSTFYSAALFNYVKNNIGIPANQIHDLSVTGSGFTGTGSANFQTIISGYTGNKAEITDILFVGGINDALLSFNNYTDTYPDVSALTNAIDNIDTYIKTNYPNAIVHTAYVGGTLTSSTMFASYHPAKSQEWAKWGWTVYAQGKKWNVLNTWNPIHLSPDNYNSDGIHPSEAYGVPAIGAEIVNAFNNKRTPLNRPVKRQSIWQVTSAVIGSSSQVNIDFTIQDDIVTLTFPDGYFMITNGTVFSNTPVKVATLDDFAQVRGRYTTIAIASYRGFNGDTMTHMARIGLILEDGGLYLRMLDVNAQGTSYQSFTADATDFSAITFFAITPITIPLYDIN